MPKKKGTKQQGAKETCTCPWCHFQKYLEASADKNAAFFMHMNRARIEFLEGMKALIDSQIKAAKKHGEPKKTVTKIRVEE